MKTNLGRLCAVMLCLAWMWTQPFEIAAQEVQGDGSGFVLMPECERNFKAFDTRLSKALPKGWNLERVHIERNRATLQLAGTQNARFSATLLHPSRYWPGDRLVQRNGEWLFALHVECEGKNSGPLLDAVEKAFGPKERAADYWTNLNAPNGHFLAQTIRNAAENLLNSGNFEVAEDLVRALRTGEPQDLDILLLDLRLGIERGDGNAGERLKKALASLESSQKLTAHLRASMDLEGVRLALKTGEEPPVPFKDFAPRDDNSCRPLSLLSTWRRMEKRDDHGVALLLDAARTYAACEAFDRELAKLLIEANRGEALIELGRLRLEHKPDDIDWLSRQATGYRLLKQHDKALEQYEKIQKISPNRDDILSAYSTVCASHPDPDAVDRRLAQRLKNDPNDLMAMHAQAVCHYYRGEFEEVLPLTDRLEKALPDNSRVWVYGGMSRYELGDSDGARERIERLPKLTNMDKDYYYCAAILAQRQDLERAKTMVRQYIDAPHTPLDRAEKIDFARDALRRLEEGRIVEEWLPRRSHDIAQDNAAAAPEESDDSMEDDDDDCCRLVGFRTGWWSLLALGFVLFVRRVRLS